MTHQTTSFFDRIAWTPTGEEALLAGLLERSSLSGAERQVSEWASRQMRALGVYSEVDATGNLIAILPATVEADEEQAPCVLLGHIDTVPGYIVVRRDGDRLYGRGAVDAKGPLAAFLAAAARLAQRQMIRSRPLIVVGAVEEEAATSRGARAVQDRWRPAYAIIGEPSGVDAVTIGYKGRLLVTCHVEQPVAHTARPEESVCARGVAFWVTLQDGAAQWNRAHAAHGVRDEASPFAELMPSLRGVSSGSDGFVEWCELEIGYRLPPNFDLLSLEAHIEELANARAVDVRFRGAEVAYRASRRGPLVGAFVRALRAEGMTPSFKLKTGTSDMNVVGPVWNCPILAYGPGDSSLDHTPQEHILLSEYARGIAVLERVLAELVAPAATSAPEGVQP